MTEKPFNPNEPASFTNQGCAEILGQLQAHRFMLGVFLTMLCKNTPAPALACDEAEATLSALLRWQRDQGQPPAPGLPLAIAAEMDAEVELLFSIARDNLAKG